MKECRIAANRIFQIVVLLSLTHCPTFAQKLLLRHYDVADGLANSVIMSTYQDKKGFLWISTQEGLSRFDGYGFVNYGVRDGLGHPIINDVKEDQQGRLWAATNGGGVSLLLDHQTEIAKGLNGKAKEKFTGFRISDNVSANQVNRILFDTNNNLWCLTDFGIYRASLSDLANLKFEPLVETKSPDAKALLEDRRGHIWFALRNELFEIASGQLINHGAPGAATSGRQAGEHRDAITGIVENKDGKLMVSTFTALYEFIPATEKTGLGQWQKQWLAFDKQKINLLFADSGGSLWIGTLNSGVSKYQNGRLYHYAKAQGFDYQVTSIAEDCDGNLWFGTFGSGVYKFGGEAFLTYTNTKDSSPLLAYQVFENHDGKIVAVLSDSSLVEIGDGEVRTLPRLEYALSEPEYSFIKVENGEWIWSALSFRLKIRQPIIARRNGQKIALTKFFTDADLRKGIGFYEDENGAVWFVKDYQDIYRLDAWTNTALIHIASAEAPLDGQKPQIVSDRNGGLWFSRGGLLCRWREQQFKYFQAADGLPAIDPRSLFLDSRGWLWVGLRYDGVSVTKNPQSDEPQFINFSTEQGLISNAVWFIAEDDFGRMYFATDRGLEQLDVEKNLWRHFNSKNGLSGDRVGSLLKDRQGELWIVTASGLTKFNPRAERPGKQPPPIYLSRVNIAGDDLPLTETGASEIPFIELPSTRNNLTIEFVGLSFTGEDNLQYQYKLEGVDADWSAPTRERVVNYARLAAGNYRFLVRAINREEDFSINPATFEFRILSPVWQRWWFLTLAVVGLGLLGYALYRYRVTRLVELERVRTRIAADLHDDIGSSLSKIAVLSEVVRRKADKDFLTFSAPLSQIAHTSREAVDAMGDIVWAINPQKDHLHDLSQRMRRFASEALLASNINFNFQFPSKDEDLILGAEVRRQVFLIFKESINNLIRHSGCDQADIRLSIEGAWLVLQVSDNGKGLNSNSIGEGNGLLSMRRRAASLGGNITFSSPNGGGLNVTMKILYKTPSRKATANK